MSDIEPKEHTASRPDGARAALYGTQTAYAAALVACGGGDDESIDLVEKYFALKRGLNELRKDIGKLLVGDHDAAFIARCEKAFQKRCNLVELELREQLDGWNPNLWRGEHPH